MLGSIPSDRTNPWAIGTAALINGSLLVLLLVAGLRTIAHTNPAPQHRSAISLDAYPLLAFHSAQGGQGGGQNNSVDASRGHLPPIDKAPLAPPQIPLLDNPKLAIRDTMAAPQIIRLPDDPSLANIGLPHSSNVTVLSGGTGTRGGIGSGDDGGVGSYHGIGFGPNDGDGVYTPGGEVSAPILVVAPEAEFTDEARRQKFFGVCMIAVIVDAHGNTRNPRIVRMLGMGLDEKALDAVSRYRFKPALRHGQPVASRVVVVNFHIY